MVALLTDDETPVTLPMAAPRSRTLEPTTRPLTSGTAIERLMRCAGGPIRRPNDPMYTAASAMMTANAANDAMFFAVLMALLPVSEARPGRFRSSRDRPDPLSR